MENTNIAYDYNLKYTFYEAIINYIQETNFRVMFGNKKNPFSLQSNSEGMKPVDVLFWQNHLSDKKLLNENVWGEYIYEIRFTKKALKVKVDYASNTREWINKNAELHDDFIETMLTEVAEWVDNIDFGLNDCDCDKEKLSVE